MADRTKWRHLTYKTTDDPTTWVSAATRYSQLPTIDPAVVEAIRHHAEWRGHTFDRDRLTIDPF